MFKDRAVQVSMVRKGPDSDLGHPQLSAKPIDLDKVGELVKDQVQNLGLVIGGVYVAKKTIDTISELALIAGRKYM